MNCKKIVISVKDLVSGYSYNEDDGIFAYGGKLNVRPPYQRTFKYTDEEMDDLIDSVLYGFPINNIYWALNNKDENYELLDGQQRTLTLCKFFNNEFSILKDGSYIKYDRLSDFEKETFLNYKLDVVVFEGSDEEKMKWFRKVNIPGKCLSKQELRNAIYNGPWIIDAKKYFSKNNGDIPTYKNNMIEKLTKAKRDDQGLLELALKWESRRSNTTIEEYMCEHRDDSSADKLRQSFRKVLDWVDSLFLISNKRSEMKSVDWGLLYDRYSENYYNSTEIRNEVEELLSNPSVTNKKGIYEFLLTDRSKKYEKLLFKRLFDDNTKLEIWKEQGEKCKHCGKKIELGEARGDHIKPWSEGGPTTRENCQILCAECNGIKSNKYYKG